MSAWNSGKLKNDENSRISGSDDASELPANRARETHNSGSEQAQAAGLGYGGGGAGGNCAGAGNNVAKTVIESKRGATIRKSAGKQPRVGGRPSEKLVRPNEFPRVAVAAKREDDIEPSG